MISNPEPDNLQHMHPGSWGVCPHCGGHDGYVVVGPEYWIVCHEHKTKWLLGESIKVQWRNQSLTQLNRVERMLLDYTTVDTEL